jgi:hypothetical protein
VNVRQACSLIVLLVIGGCASQPDATHSVSRSSSATQASAIQPATASKPTPRRPTNPQPAVRRTATVNPDAVAPSRQTPVPTAADQESAARAMEERARKWDAAAAKALKSICAGC